MNKLYVAGIAFLLSFTGCIEDGEDTEIEEVLEVEDTEPASDNNEDIGKEPEPVVRNWWCSSSGMGGHHVDPAYEGMTKGELSDEDCQLVNEQFAAAITWAMQWPTLGEAEDDDFHMVVDYVEGMGTHHTRIGNFSMDDDFDPNDPEFPETGIDGVFEYDRPEFLMYSGTESDSTLVGFAWYVKTNSTTPPEGFARDNDWWHRHNSLCFRDATFQVSGEDLSDEECESGPAINVHLHDYWMAHAWIIEPWLQQYDVFANYHPCLSQEGAVTDPEDDCWMEAMHGGMHDHEEESVETQDYNMTVVEILDGDTFDLGNGERVRIIGINTPEKGRPFSDEATDALSEMIMGKEVTLVNDSKNDDVDTNGRLLRHVYVDGTSVNYEMIRMGMAFWYPYSSGTDMDESYQEAQEAAANDHTGLWTESQYNITIDYIEYDPDGSEVDGEYLIITNHDNYNINMEGWYLQDEAARTAYKFNYTLETNTSVIIYTGSGEDNQTTLFWGWYQGIWNNGGDMAILQDENGLMVDYYRYGYN